MSQRSCEICRKRPVIDLDLEDRLVQLCAAHAREAQTANVTSMAELRRIFVEPDGRRALLARRASDERRLFPPRPEGRRHDDGRRESDTALPERPGLSRG